MAGVVHEYTAHMTWPARTSVTVEVCKSFGGGQEVPGFAQQLREQMAGWVPQLPVPPTAKIDRIAHEALKLAQQIGGSTLWVRVAEGEMSTIQRIEY